MQIWKYTLIGATALFLVGCAHQGTAPRVTWVPDGFNAVTTTPQAEATQAQTVKKSVKTTGFTTGRMSISGAAMLADTGKAVGRSGLNVRTRRTRAQQGKSTNNGKKGYPHQLNLPKLIKMGGFANIMGANRLADSSKFKSKDRSQARMDAKKAKGMLNLPMLIKMGGISNWLLGNKRANKRGNPGQLNLGILIKMGGMNVERPVSHRVRVDRIPDQMKNNAMKVPKALRRTGRPSLMTVKGINDVKANVRQTLGGRCIGRRCSE